MRKRSTSESVEAPNILPVQDSSRISRLLSLLPLTTHGFESARALRNSYFQLSSPVTFSPPSSANGEENHADKLCLPIRARLVQWILRARLAFLCRIWTLTLKRLHHPDTFMLSVPRTSDASLMIFTTKSTKHVVVFSALLGVLEAVLL